MKLKVMFLKSSKHLLQMVHMISCSQAKNNDVITIAFGKTKTCQNSIHDPLKFYKGIFQTKWQKLPLVQIVLPMGVNSPKCFFDFITFPQWQLMVARSQVQGIKKPWLDQGHQKSLLVRAWHICLNMSTYH